MPVGADLGHEDELARSDARARLLMVATVGITLSAFLLPFARHYRAQGWRVEAAAGDIDEASVLSDEFDACHQLPLSRSLCDIGAFLRAPAAIRRLVAAGRYDIVHVHTPLAAFLVRFALRHRAASARPRVVYTAHGFHFHRHGRALSNFIFHAAERLAASWCDVIVTINGEDHERARASRFSADIVYMPGIGVDTALWHPACVNIAAIQAVRSALGLADDAVLFLMVAEFNAGKRHRDVLAALAQPGLERVHVAFAGDGPLRVSLAEQAARAGLAARTHFLGFRRDVPTLMAASRAVLLPSEREGLPRCLLEALSMGVPVVATNIRGAQELVRDECGYLHEIGDVAALASALRELTADAASAAAMGARGRVRMVQVFDVNVVIALHDQLYEGLLKGGI